MDSNEEQRNKRIVRITVAAFIAIIALSIYQLIQNNRFHLVQSNPPQKGTIATSLPGIMLEFNHELDPNVDYLKQLSDPSKHIQSAYIDKKTLVLFTNTSQVGKRYVFSVRNIKAKSGTVIPNIDFDQTAAFIPNDELSAKQQRLITTLNTYYEKRYPIVKQLPHGSLHYTLSATFNNEEGSANGKLILIAKLFVSGAEQRYDREGAIAAHKKEVEDYITSLGYKPSDFTIDYQVIEP